MSWSNLIPRAGKIVADNSPNILTAVGVVGTVTTAVLTGKAAYSSANVLSEESPHLDARERVALCWRLYIPAVGTGALTVTAILAANHVGTRRAAGLAAAYSLSDRAFAEYREKVVEQIGSKKEQVVRDQVAQDRVTASSGSREIVVVGTDVPCYDSYTGRYFSSSMETLKAAQNKINYRLNNDGYASLTDFYNEVGLGRTKFSDEIGWSSISQLELTFSTVLSEDQRPCLSISFRTEPIRDYYQFH